MLIDENGDEFPLKYNSGLIPTGTNDYIVLFGYLSDYDSLPTGKKFQKVVLKSNIPIKTKSVVWTGWDKKDRK